MKSDFKLSNLLGTVYAQGNLVFTSDGTQLLSPVGNRVSCFDLVQNKSYTFPYEHRRRVARIAINKQETLLLSVDVDGRAILVNFKSRAVLHHFNFKDAVRDLQFSPDSQHFAIACGRFVQVWKTPSIAEDRVFAPFVRHRVHAGHFGDITSISWSSDSRFFITTSKDLTSRLWSLDSAESEVKMTLAGHRDTVVRAFFSQDQETIYTISKDGALFTWKYTKKPSDDSDDDEDSENDEDDDTPMSWRIHKKDFFFSEAKLKCATFHPESNVLIVGFSNGEFRLYELPEFNMIQQLSMGQDGVDTVSVNSTGEWLAFGSAKLGQLLVYEWQSESYILKQQGHFDSTNALCYSPDGSRVVTASDDGKIKIWDVVSGFCLATFEEHSSSVTAVKFAKRGQVLFSASLDGTVKAWDLVRYRNFRTFTATERIKFSSLAVDPSGEVVCAASQDTFEIYVWSVQTAQLVETLSGHTGPVSCLAFGVENSVLASASWDKTVRVWHLFGRSQHTEPFDVHNDVLALAMRSDSKQIAVSTLSGQIQFWDVEEAKETGHIDARRDIIMGRYLEDRFSAKNSARGKNFTTLDYSFDGLSLVAAGNNNSICLYDVPNGVLLKRFTVSLNMELDGTQKFLNSSRMTEAGSLDLIDRDGENSDLEDRIDNSLPGSKRGGDPSLRSTRPEVRVTHIQFSPTASAFAAAATEGVLIFSVDDRVVFDPFDLDMDVTTETTLETLKKKDYLTALVMSFRLNEAHLIHRVYEAIPVKDVKLIASDLPIVYVERLLSFIGEQAMSSQHIEYHLLWVSALVQSHGKYINTHKHEFSKSLRAVQRVIARVAKDIAKTGKENEYSYLFLKSGAKHVEAGIEEDQDDVVMDVSGSEASDDDAEEDDEEDIEESDDENGGWFGAKAKNLPVDSPDESSSEEDSDEEME
ncbi:CYFA0S12e03070g1_1 [Cyberlindnera fabianii]|uniref:CYFA0S12e03070g1_1 n=1 Tax=Cyberlindnera fabianii TaxID=36022 RepID=A0A061B2I4_CYBFA|nr:CYFA0S12e03070g1_1 [Cyberlindnera fabianii]